MPEKVLRKLKESILPQLWVCFFSALVVGLIAHLYKITNWLPNWDSLVFRYDSQNMLGLGRWFLPVVCSFSSFYDLPFLNGLMAILFHALGGVCICKILNIEKNITAFLIGAVIVSFPTVTSVMMYNYVADGYSIAFFLSCLAALYLTREKPRYILSAVLIALSSGIYQAYITVTIMLILLKLIDEIIYNNATFKAVLKKSVFMLLTGIAGVAIYYGILKILLGVFSMELLDYQGINGASSMSALNIWGSLYSIKETFLDCFFDISEGVNVYVVLNVIALSLTLMHYVKYIIVNKIYKNPVNILFLAVLGVLLILGAGALAFMNADIDYHNLMLMGYSVFYLFFIVLYERGTDKNEVHTCGKRWTVLLVGLTIILNQVVIANVSYHKAQIAYEKSYGALMRIADRIEFTEGAEDSSRILVIGALDNSGDYSVNLTPDITGITDGYIIRADDETVGQSVLCSALNDYCDKNYEFLSGDEKKEFLQKEEVKAMKEWPSVECISLIDDVIVIKLNSEGE
ncbi:MAG: glucosyltransferase domain-containing protein [Clostridia bacterium]|nr:glucosyltransferase domain-containing protein [Clostridia bacterium]